MSGNHQEESVLAAHRCSERIGPEFQDKHNEEGGGGGGRGGEEGRSHHRKSTSTAEERKPAAERKTLGERESLSWYSAPHLSGKTCPRWTQLCRLVGQRSSFLAAMAINWKALWKQCAVDRLESLGSNNPTRQFMLHPG